MSRMSGMCPFVGTWRLMRKHLPSWPARIILPQQKCQQKHDSRGDSKHPERIDVRERRRLIAYGVVNPRQCLHVRPADTALPETIRETRCRIAKARIPEARVTREHHLVHLRTAGEYRRNGRRPDTAADVSH